MQDITVFCQVGFGVKESPKEVYFHEKDWEAVWFEIPLWDAEKFLDPFSLEDLIRGSIPYELLPPDLRNTIQDIASRTFACIQSDKPQESSALDPTDAMALFYSPLDPKTFN